MESKKTLDDIIDGLLWVAEGENIGISEELVPLLHTASLADPGKIELYWDSESSVDCMGNTSGPTSAFPPKYYDEEGVLVAAVKEEHNSNYSSLEEGLKLYLLQDNKLALFSYRRHSGTSGRNSGPGYTGSETTETSYRTNLRLLLQMDDALATAKAIEVHDGVNELLKGYVTDEQVSRALKLLHHANNDGFEIEGMPLYHDNFYIHVFKEEESPTPRVAMVFKSDRDESGGGSNNDWDYVTFSASSVEGLIKTALSSYLHDARAMIDGRGTTFRNHLSVEGWEEPRKTEDVSVKVHFRMRDDKPSISFEYINR